MIRCIRLWSSVDGSSHFEDGSIELSDAERGDFTSLLTNVVSISFRETASGGSFQWHNAPTRQFVVTLSGTLEFETRDGQKFIIHPGDILLAEDTIGSGHKWRLLDQQPWRRAYIILDIAAKAPFVKAL
jgi:mannose-6-phosphate isomerase-like protein (cupin superfamily)